MGQNLVIQTGYMRGAGRVCSDGVESAGEQVSEYDLANTFWNTNDEEIFLFLYSLMFFLALYGLKYRQILNSIAAHAFGFVYQCPR